MKSDGIIVTNDHMTRSVGQVRLTVWPLFGIAIDQAKVVLMVHSALPTPSSHLPITWKESPKRVSRYHQPGARFVTKKSLSKRTNMDLTMIFTGVRHFRH